VYHVDRHKLLGGISHFSSEEQEKIIQSTTVPTHFCCDNPYWLFKIFQDTRVQTSEIIELIEMLN
jgi:protein O-mannose beta-1,4-N-acetylglucosaminyltransferase